MNQSLNKRKNNNNKFYKSFENFQINMNNINITKRAKTRRNKKCWIKKAEEEAEVKTKEEKPVEQSKEEPKDEPKEETKKEQKEEVKNEPKEEQKE